MQRVISALLMLSGGTLMAYSATHYAGEWDNIPENQRTWFRNVHSPQGVPCCDIADGHRTDWEQRADGYYVPVPQCVELDIKCAWLKVPPEAVVQNAGNPTGDAVIWYVDYGQYGSSYNGQRYFIRCFVPGNGV